MPTFLTKSRNFFTFSKPKIGREWKNYPKMFAREITVIVFGTWGKKKPATTSQIVAGSFFEKREKREKRECVS